MKKLLRAISWRRVLASLPMVGLICLLVGLPAGYGFIEYTTRPQFCASCHNMEPYVKSWAESSHNKVPCVDCHYEPGLLETAEGKFKAMSQLAKYVTGTAGTKPWAEVSDASCMRSGCHSTRLLAGKVDFQVGNIHIAFDHTPHLLEMRRSKKLRCTSCHSQIVQGEHVSVTPSTCFLCHFKGSVEDPKLANCNTCHGPPDKPIDLAGFTFDHKDYVSRGVGCESCHSTVNSGTGEVPKRRCGSCHAVVEHIERYGETEFLHRKHVTEHKVDCLECHTEITHRLGTREAKLDAGGCGECHRSGHSSAEEFQRGAGGRLVGKTPGAMWLARVACAGCHLHLPHFEKGNDAPTAAREVACLSCHGPGFEGMMGRWQSRFDETTRVVLGELDDVMATASGSDAGTKLLAGLSDARHDALMVKQDGSRGVHNPWFAWKLLRAAADRVDAARKVVAPGAPPAAFPLAPRFETKLDCAKLCHMGIDERSIGLEGTRFEHSRHLGKAGDCNRCHTIEPHGGKLIGKDDCIECHHGPERPKDATCATCHAEVDAFLRGVEGGRDDEPVQMMAKIACTECHGDPPATTVHETAQENCLRCHGDKYEDMLEEWLDYSSEWFGEADERLAPLREKAATADAAGKAAFARASDLVEHLRRVRPAHNIMLFEELTEQFDDLADAAEKALK